MKSILYVTTATSGSASIMRVLEAMLVPPYRLVTPKVLANDGKVRIADVPPEGALFLVRGTSEFEAPVYDPRYRYVVNFRDPRDMLCNQYHWLVQHPTNAPDEQQHKAVEAARRDRYERGIDASVLRVPDDKGFSFIWELQEAAAAGSDVQFVSYAQLCCAFDVLVERLTSFLGVTLTDKQRAAVELERADNLAANPKWIGQEWFGTDIMPGRFRHELKPETIAVLNARFATTLERLKTLDVPELRHLYD